MSDPKAEATATALYLATLLEQGVEPEVAAELTCAWILSKQADKSIQEAVERENKKEPWQ